jgi:hypothetical protein
MYACRAVRAHPSSRGLGENVERVILGNRTPESLDGGGIR